MNGFEKMRNYCKNMEFCLFSKCPYEYECDLSSGNPSTLTDGDITRLCELAQDDEPAFGRWIPVSERLPEDGYCILSLKENGICETVPAYLSKENLEEIKRHKNKFSIVAWMPLPEPYKEETNE